MTDWRRPYRAYLFDLDGTLVDTAPDINAALNHCLQPLGVDPIDVDTTRHWVGHGARVLIEQATAALPGQQFNTEELLAQFLAYYGEHIADLSQPYPTVVETLHQLQQRGAKLAVVTNKLTNLPVRLLKALELYEMFDCVVCGDTTSQPKPAADPVLWCLKELGTAPNDALFIGDSDTDVNAAKAAEVAVVCMRDGYNHGIDVASLNPDAVIDRFSELVAD